MPTVLRIGPYRISFWSKENDEPPHVHVRRNRFHAKYWLEPLSLAENRRFPLHELTRIRKILQTHRIRLLDAGMTTLAKRILEVEPTSVRVTPESLSVDLADGRTISVPLQWFPRLMHGTPAEWQNYELSFDGVHWEDLNEDISVDALFCGYKSGESPKSLRRWLKYRAQGEKEPILELPLPADLAEELNLIWSAERQPPARRRSRRNVNAKRPRTLVKS